LGGVASAAQARKGGGTFLSRASEMRTNGERVAFDSTMLARGEYLRETHVLRLEFHAGGVYEYRLVPPSIFEALREADSPGTYFRERIADHFPCVRIR
jgi:hypothetical protein